MIKKLVLTLIISFFSSNVFATQLNITINHKVVDGKVFISGVTNLPEGTKIGVDVSSNNGYSAQSYNLFIKSGGAFKSEGFSDKGNPLVGSYNVEVISYINGFWQNKEILKKLVTFSGNGIQDDEILVKYSMSIGTVKEIQRHIADLPTKKQETLVKKYCYAQQAALLCDYLQMRVDTQEKIENQIGAKINDTKYKNICLQGISDAFDNENKGLCSKLWKQYGCNGNNIPRLIQENPFKKSNANLCEY